MPRTTTAITILLFVILSVHIHALADTVATLNGLKLVVNEVPMINPRVGSEGFHKALLRPLIPNKRLWELAESITLVTHSKVVKPVETPFGVVSWAPLGTPTKPVTRDNESKGRVLMLIVTPRRFIDIAEKIARLHKDLETLVLTWSDVEKLCKRVEEPSGVVDSLEFLKRCGRVYNMTRALCLVSLERELLRKGLRYLLILGPDSDSPPFYYLSPILDYLVGGCQALVPTDYWFMDPDYDWEPEVAVGRLPFNNTLDYMFYLDALKAWLNGSRTGYLLAGGALFQTTLMLGEYMVSEVSRAATRLGNGTVLLLTLGGYKPGCITPRVGRYALYYIVSHGVGDTLVDVFPKGLWGTSIHSILSPKELLVNVREPGVYVTPACLAAYWDYWLTRPPFKPGSVALELARKGYAIAFLGSARIAVAAIIGVELKPDGGVIVDAMGALRLTSIFASMLTKSSTIGEALVKSYASYLSLAHGVAVAYTPQGSEDVSELTVLEFTLIGDPAALAPRAIGEKPCACSISVRGYATIPAKYILAYYADIAKGEAPLINATPSTTVTLTVEGSVEEATVVSLSRYYSVELSEATPEPITTRSEGNETPITFNPVNGPSLHTVVVLCKGGVVERRVFLVAGSSVKIKDGFVEFEAIGLDVLRVLGDEPVVITVCGRPVATIPGGVEYIKLRMPAPTCSEPVLVLTPWRVYTGIVSGGDVAREVARLLEKLFTHKLPRKPSIEVLEVQPGAVYLRILGATHVEARNATLERISGSLYVVRGSGTALIKAFNQGLNTTLEVYIPPAYKRPTTTPTTTPSTTIGATVISRPSRERGETITALVLFAGLLAGIVVGATITYGALRRGR